MMVHGPSEARDLPLLELVGRIADADVQATNAFVATCRPSLVSFAASRGSADPDGVADAALLTVIMSIDRLEFETPKHVWAYLYRSARSKLADERRRQHQDLPVEDHTIESSVEVQDDFAEVVVGRVWADEMLSQLTVDQREVLELRFLDDLSIEETAVRTGRTKTAVKALQRRALRAVVTVVAAAAAVIAVVTIGIPAFGDEVAGPTLEEGPPSADTPGVPGGSGSGDLPEGGIVSDEPVFEVAVGQSVDLSERFGDDLLDGEPGQWAQVGGPDGVYFVQGAGGPTAILEFEEAGIYRFRYEALGSGAAVADEIVIEVQDPAVADTVYSCMGLQGTVAQLEDAGYDVTIGTDGNDVLDVSDGSAPDFVIGGPGNDVITTGDGADYICGRSGEDTIRGGPGADQIDGGTKADQIWGEQGRDTIHGGYGKDRLSGGSGKDTLVGGWGHDALAGGDHNDNLDGGPGNDVVTGGGGNDVIDGGPGHDEITPGGSGDRIQGLESADTITVVRAEDTCRAGETLDGSFAAADLLGQAADAATADEDRPLTEAPCTTFVDLVTQLLTAKAAPAD